MASNKFSSKYHYPRAYTEGAMCDVTKLRRTDSVDFFSARRGQRCQTCEKLLRRSGADVDRWIKSMGGTL